MIIKISRSKTASSFTKLAGYICQAKPGKEGRIQSVTTAGFDIEQPDWEIAGRHIAEQHREKTRNLTRNPDNTLHIIISFRSAERGKLDEAALEGIAQRVCESIRLGAHKRIAAVHGDTRDPHMHLAVSLLDDQGRRCAPYKAFIALREVRQAIEKQYGFAPPGERTARSPSDPNRKRERHSNQASFEGWLKTNIVPGLTAEIQRGGASWDSVQDYLATHGTTLRKQGAGLVFSSTRERVFCKASTVDRLFSFGKLQAALGPWRDVETKTASPEGFKSEFIQSRELYAEYKREADANRRERTAARDAARKDFKTARDSIAALIRVKKEMVMKKETNPNLRVARLKALTFERSQLMETVREDSRKRTVAISASFQHKTWVRFLQDKAQTGDLTASRALQSRNDAGADDHGNQVYTPGAWEPVGNTLRGLKARIRINGDLAYQLPRGREEIIDRGRRLLVADTFSAEALDAVLKLALAKFGPVLHLRGSNDFKTAVMKRARETNLKISFAGHERTNRNQTNER